MVKNDENVGEKKEVKMQEVKNKKQEWNTTWNNLNINEEKLESVEVEYEVKREIDYQNCLVDKKTTQR